MRVIKYIVVHCAATKASADIGAVDIRRWHVKGNGWRDIGYHYVIRRGGAVEPGRPLEQAGAHVAGYNSHSIGICLVGGLDESGRAENNFTPPQFDSLKALTAKLSAAFPKAEILGHRDFPGVKKDCPCFEVRKWVEEAGLK